MYSLKLFENGWKVDRKELGNRIIRFIHLIEYFAYVSCEDLSIFLLEREEDVAFLRRGEYSSKLSEGNAILDRIIIVESVYFSLRLLQHRFCN